MKKILLVLFSTLLSIHSLNAVSWKTVKKYAKPAAKYTLVAAGMYSACGFYYLTAVATSKSASNLYFACKTNEIEQGSIAMERGVEGLFRTAVFGSMFLASCIGIGILAHSAQDDIKQIQNEQ